MHPENPDRNGYEIEDNNGVVLLLALILVSLIIIAFLVVAMIVVFLKEKRKEKSLDHNRISN
jgi:Tfp pilus assembly protein PilX